jgi:hypothetical protein
LRSAAPLKELLSVIVPAVLATLKVPVVNVPAPLKVKLLVPPMVELAAKL